MVAAASRKSSSKSVAMTGNENSHGSASAVLWDKKMSNNCASALLVYTMLQIFVVISFIETKGMSIAPYFGLVLLVAFIIPFCRKYEKRWEKLAGSNIPDANMALRYRRDQITLWVLALGLPFVFIGLIKLGGQIFS